MAQLPFEGSWSSSNEGFFYLIEFSYARGRMMGDKSISSRVIYIGTKVSRWSRGNVLASRPEVRGFKPV